MLYGPFQRQNYQIIYMYVILNPQLVKKTFVFEKQETKQSVMVDFQLDISQNEVNINNLLSSYCSQIQHNVFIYDPCLNHFVSIKAITGQNGLISKTFFEPQIILIRYSLLNGVVKESNQHLLQNKINLQKPVPKRMRIKERTIVQVVQMIKIWRFLNINIQKTSNRRLNLEECSKLVGISKKSLDDYYCQLRLGEYYNFDFTNKLYEKMGVLRNFVSRCRGQKNEQKKCFKYPKKLKIIESFDLETRTLQPLIPLRPIKIKEENKQLTNEFMQEYSEIIPDYQPFLFKACSSQGDFFNGFFQASRELNDYNLEVQKNNENYSFEFGTQSSNIFFDS